MKPTRTFDFLYVQKENFPKNDSLAYKVNGQWKKFSTDDVIEIVNNLSVGLLIFGVKKGDKVAIISSNRPEWNFIDLACQQIGVIVVPIYPTITVSDYSYIFDHSDAKYIFVGDSDLYSKSTEAAKSVEKVEKIFTFDKVDNAPHWTEIELLGKGKSRDKVVNAMAEVKPEDLLTIIYTSGTTGRPKGVMLSHQNVVSNAIAVSSICPIEKGKSKALSFLPLCHIFERTGFYYFLQYGVSVYYAESMETIGANLQEVKPDVFNTVPRLLEKIYDKIIAKGLDAGGAKKGIFFWALNLGLRYEPRKEQGFIYNSQLELANKLVFSKWRDALGGNVKAINIGAAALQPRLARVFWSAGIKLCEGYGLTETSPVIAVNRANNENMMVGTVGPLLDGVEVKIAEDGEILAKGPNVMMGYYKAPEKTEEVIKDGWFHTGDIGEFVEGKFLKITDRKKEMFKTSGGKYVAPQLVENKIKESYFIEQAAVIGNNRKFPSALIVPNFDGLKEWCNLHNIEYTSDSEIIKNTKVIEKMDQEIQKANKQFAQWEKVKKFALIDHVWSIDSGEVTPTLKLKRKVINERYDHVIEGLYS
ncbi:AMP-dependent synthetase/ligase [Flammeovirga kamogawensis]|uniref:Long-chain fatty acid--CoA ligase n=1 Tax=Flammeovirga kamogawensis TaxID=373891 RepID=A0ABX8H049_9BACT|nr:long-chain fatty acid--CoA ligase [Flammeovirga kamogawensis]MBB6459481.1 long-chain acyl-CoA synthetase [Flammeovirga kamogawensis]QWG09033.1 long-chain fatty acid--CoA ligase [Flammeovirga kamogawensis]TRX67321.1 long-chain fatty acid--CoA ligase [Flammeovirga kamogawensis]